MIIQTVPDFIVIDDDSFNNVICRKCIEIGFPSASIRTFTDPDAALEHIEVAYGKPGANKVMIFLDINMHVLSGWDVLHEFMNYPDSVRNRFGIFMMSSSAAYHDRQTAEENPLVSGYIEKPLTKVHLQGILPNLYRVQ